MNAQFKCTSIAASESRRPRKDASGSVIRDRQGFISYEPIAVAVVTLAPVFTPDRRIWMEGLTTGDLKMVFVDKAEASKRFQVGQEYCLDFNFQPVG